MFPTMTSASKVNGILFIAMLTVMFCYSVPKLWDFATHETQAVRLYADGQLSRKFEDDYDSQFFLRETAIKAWSNISYWLFGEGMTGVVVGRDGWLFTNEEFTFPNNLQFRIDEQFSLIDKVAASIRESGKQLIILPIPMKVDIYGEHVDNALGNRPELLYTQFTNQLKQRDIPFSPLRDAYMKSRAETQLFFKKDTHWTPEGARLAAKKLAETFPELLGDESYRSEVAQATSHLGDLTNFITVSDWLAPEVYAAETLNQYQTLSTSQNADSVDEASLFGISEPPIVVVGSSYTKMDEWNFKGFVKEYLKTDILSVAIEEKGQFVAMDEFLGSDLLTDESIKTVVWEFPVRSLITRTSRSSGWLTTTEDIF
ncbi:MAG: alginate O-acetyltransferase AlgX-related protein [Marinobacter sp.]